MSNWEETQDTLSQLVWDWEDHQILSADDQDDAQDSE